ncbi:MAG: protein kinase [Planctomycetota bacterium]|jgi:tetratricopeptide (TPR) repeat protein|nr:protein kinase [Planctomycetota bacterium]
MTIIISPPPDPRRRTNLELAPAPAGNNGREPGGQAAAEAADRPSTPDSENMKTSLGSQLDKTLTRAKGDFLAGLLEQKEDDPSQRDYGERYHYLDILGEGGQGKVLRFRDTVLDRDVAIKTVKPPFTSDREKQLENEARLGGMLEHPNILPTYDLCRDETGSPFFVMKKVEGVSLDDLLKKAHAEGSAIYSDRDRGEFSRRRLLNVFIQVCHAIEYAHSRGVWHLDLKPQNVKLGPFGEVYVIDWGLAIQGDDNPKRIGGTPLYIAPERFHQGRPDARCDIYSLGVMLYRILLNQLPRDVGNITFREFRERLKEFPVIPPRQRDPSLPRDLDAIVMKAIRDNPEERYQTVAELANDLERFLDLMPVSAYREGWYGRALKFTRRHRTTVLAGMVMFTAVVLTALASAQARNLAAQAEEAELRVEEERLNRERAKYQLALAEDARRDTIRRRAAARVPLEKGSEIMEKSKTAVDKERDNSAKLRLLQPSIDLYTQAVAIHEEELKDNPDAAEAYYARARAYEQAREIGKAIADYRQAYSRDESYIMAHYYLGRIYFDINRDPDRAMVEFAAMNDIDPGNEFSELGRAYIEAQTGHEAAALERINRIETVDLAARGDAASGAGESWRNPGLHEIWLIRGNIYGRRDSEFYNPEKAIEAYSIYCRYQPDKPSAYLNRGILNQDLYLRLKTAGQDAEAETHLDQAIADYSQALMVNPEFKWALQHRGYALFKHKNQPVEGLADIEEALRLDPNYTAALFDRAAIRETRQEYDLAAVDYERILTLNPENRNIDYRIGVLSLYMDRLPEAEAAFDQAIGKASSPADRGIRVYRRGVIRFLRGRYQDAVADFDTSLELRGEGKIYPNLMRWLALARLGKSPDPIEFAHHIDAGPNKPWLEMVASIYLGEAPFLEETAISLAAGPEAMCETAFYLGARAWVRGETVNALAFLKMALDSGVTIYTEYNMAKILYNRLSRQEETARKLPDQVGTRPSEPPPTVPSLNDLVSPRP